MKTRADAGDIEAATLLSFREALHSTSSTNATVDPVTAIRFLRARKGIVAKAVQMYSAYAEWRELEHVDDVLEDDWTGAADEALSSAFSPKLLDSTDKLGRPIWFLALGNLDVSALAKQGVTLSMLRRRHIRMSEQVR